MKRKKVDIEEILKLPNSRFRSTDDKNQSGYIFDSQIETAKDAVREIARMVTRKNHIILAARMQSGKTGVCNAIANIISQTPIARSLAIDKYMFITGMNDCGLKHQTENRVLQQCMGANIDNTYTGKKSKRNLSPNKYFVMKNSDLLKFEGDINNTIIFIDECHYGSNAKNILTKFLEKQEIDWRDRNDLIRRNIYIISVSATPFDEIVSDTVGCKKIVELKPSDNYIGVSELLNRGLVYDADTNDIDEDGEIFNMIDDARQRMIDNGEYGIIIIRTRHFNVIENNDMVRRNFDMLEMISGGSNIEYERFNQLATELASKNRYNASLKNFKTSSVSDLTPMEGKPLLVLIKGAYRAGITLNHEVKDYIYMLYDYSKRADTTAQALLGRLCGYRAEDSSINNVRVYINKKFSEMYSHWENDMQNRGYVPSSRTTFEWIPNNVNRPEATLGSKSAGNIEIDLSDAEIRRIYQVSRKVKSRVRYMESELPKILSDHGIKDLQYDYVGEAVLNGRNNYKETKRFDGFSPTSMVYQFRPYKIKKFMDETGRDFLTKDDLGKSAVYAVLDANIDDGGLKISGNKRLLLYHAEVGQRIVVPNVSSLYKIHKDTNLRKRINNN